jgi:hypothetical protein
MNPFGAINIFHVAQKKEWYGPRQTAPLDE